MAEKEDAISLASWATTAGITRVVIPIRRKLSIHSVIAALQEFKDQRLLNASVSFTEEGCFVEFLFTKIPKRTK